MRLLLYGSCLAVAMMFTSCESDTSPIATVNPTSTPTGATATPTVSGFTTTITIGGGDGTGIVTASPTGPHYPPGTVVTFTAVADAGSCFGGWTASCESFGRKAICTVTISASTNVGAEFDKACPTPYCHAISAQTAGGPGICPSGATQFCDLAPIVATSKAQAQMACDTCLGEVCGACLTMPCVGFDVLGKGWAVFAYGAVTCDLGLVMSAGEIRNPPNCETLDGRWAP